MQIKCACAKEALKLLPTILYMCLYFSGRCEKVLPSVLLLFPVIRLYVWSYCFQDCVNGPIYIFMARDFLIISYYVKYLCACIFRKMWKGATLFFFLLFSVIGLYVWSFCFQDYVNLVVYMFMGKYFWTLSHNVKYLYVFVFLGKCEKVLAFFDYFSRVPFSHWTVSDVRRCISDCFSRVSLKLKGAWNFVNGLFLMFILYIPLYKSIMRNISFAFVKFKE